MKKRHGGSEVVRVVHSKGVLMFCRSPCFGMIVERARQNVWEISSDADVNYRADVAGIIHVR